MLKWNNVFKNGPSKTCGRQSLKKLKRFIYLFIYTLFNVENLQIVLAIYNEKSCSMLIMSTKIKIFGYKKNNIKNTT